MRDVPSVVALAIDETPRLLRCRVGALKGSSQQREERCSMTVYSILCDRQVQARRVKPWVPKYENGR